MLFTFEGCDRTGKTTQVHALHKTCGGLKLRFPERDTPIGRLISHYLNGNRPSSETQQMMQMLFAANRFEKKREIEEALRAKQHIFCDRYSHSGIAYGMALGFDRKWLENLETDLPRPDIIFHLKGGDASKRTDFGSELYETEAFQRKVSDAYDQILVGERVVEVNAALPIEEVTKIISQHIAATPS